jgi:hypothetical protein
MTVRSLITAPTGLSQVDLEEIQGVDTWDAMAVVKSTF